MSCTLIRRITELLFCFAKVIFSPVLSLITKISEGSGHENSKRGENPQTNDLSLLSLGFSVFVGLDSISYLMPLFKKAGLF